MRSHAHPFRQVLATIVLSALVLSLLPEAPAFAASSWNPTLLVNTEAFQVIDNTDSAATQLELRFGDVVGQRLFYDRSNLRFQFTRSLLVSGDITATGSITAGRVLSGNTLRVSGNADVQGALTASGTFRTDSNITINDDADSNNAVLTFGNTSGNQTLTYLNAGQRFQFSKYLSVVGTISGSSLNVDRNATVGGTLTVTGAVTGVSSITAKTVLSGTTLRVSGNADVQGALVSSGSIRTDNNLTLNDNQSAADAVLTFGNASGNQTLSYLNTPQLFKFSKSLSVVGTISGTTLRSWGSTPNTFSGSIITEGAFSGATFFGSGLGSCSNGTTDKLLYNPTTGKFSCGTDQTGGGTSGGSGVSYAAAEGMFVNQGGDTMTGGLSITVASADTVKTTTGNSAATDFSVAGSTLLNVTSSNDAINIDEGTVPAGGQGTMSTSTVTTSAAVGAGGMTIVRDDGRYVVIHGNATATASVWDGIAGGAMSASPTNATTATIGAGAIALKRPDGRYLVVNGGGAATSALFDPFGVTATAAGPALTSCTATTGTNAFLVASGSYIIMCGGSANWGQYNGTANVYIAGPALGASFGAGAFAISRDDGTFLVFAGGNTTTHWLYNPYNNQWVINPISTNAPTITTGAFAIRRTDGKWLILPGAQNSSYIYDPMPYAANYTAGSMTAQSGAGYGPTAALADGAQAIWRQDGKYLLFIGGATTTNIVDVSRTDNNQFTTGPATAAALGAGAHVFTNARGTVQIIRGGATTTTYVYDMGYIIGGNYTSTGAIYETECISAPSMGTGSRMEWDTDADAGLLQFQVRHGNGSCTGNYQTIGNNGDLIYPNPGDDHVQMKVIFKRAIGKFVDQEWGLRRGLGQVRYRRANKDPTLYDVMIRNTVLLHRTQFDFGGSGDASGPIAVNIRNDKNRNMQIALASQLSYGTTYNATQQNIYNGAFGSHPAMPTAASIGTIIMKRPDDKYVILPGSPSGGAGSAFLYDAGSNTFSTMSSAPTVRASTGALAFKRPDGKFFIVLGGGTKTTSIYDPVANTFTQGPDMMSFVGEGSLPMMLPNGNVLIMHGGFQRSTTMYNPFTNTSATGALSTLVMGRGAIVIPRPDGRYFIVPGTSNQACALQTATMLFDPYTMRFVNDSAAAITTGTGPGAFAFERQDGMWVIIKGGGTANTCAGVTATNIYNPFTNRMIVGATLAAATRHGSQALPRPDGTWLITNGGALTTTQIYYEKAGAFTADIGSNGVGVFVAGPATTSAVGTGAVAFQREDGKFFLTAGSNAVASAGTTTAMLYDAGWVTNGFYRSELMNIPSLDSTSTFSWKATPSFANISASVRTGTSALMTQVNTAREVRRSGDPISPGTGETWLQVTFNLSRTLPTYNGIYQDTWFNGGTTTDVTQRDITTPTITEFSVGKDTNIVDMKADGQSVFRVSTNGDIYSGNRGSIYSGGADLAERYTSPDGLEPGEVVSMDFTDSHGVRRSTSAYQPEVLGVVSTNPGFVAGSFTVGSYPIALVGRVPVRVSLENGPIHPGDRLVASSLPGYAMKAARAGRTVGVALAALDVQDTQPCKADPRKECGTVMMFVNLSDYQGPAN